MLAMACLEIGDVDRRIAKAQIPRGGGLQRFDHLGARPAQVLVAAQANWGRSGHRRPLATLRGTALLESLERKRFFSSVANESG
jgi:hypothetical protein